MSHFLHSALTQTRAIQNVKNCAKSKRSFTRTVLAHSAFAELLSARSPAANSRIQKECARMQCQIKRGIKKIAYFLALLLVTQSCHEKTDIEVLIEYGTHLRELKAFEYQVIHKTTYSYTDQITTRKGLAYFEGNSEDTILGYNYYFNFERDPWQFISFYAGDKEINLRLNDSVAYLRDLSALPFYKVVDQPLFMESILSIEKWITDDSIKSKISFLELKDTIISKHKCKLFSFETDASYFNWWYKKPLGTNKYDLRIAFEIKSRMPVYLQSKMYFKDSEYALMDVWFSHLVEKRYSKEKLSIESVPEYYNWGIEQKKLALNTIGPNFNLPDTFGDSLELHSLRGNYVLLQFGFIGCGPCAKSIPQLNQIDKRYNSKGLKVIGVNLYCGSQDKVRAYQERHNIDYDFLWSDNDSIANKYQVTSAPTIYILNDRGEIIYVQIGYDEKKLNLQLESIFGT